ncbi:MAG: hypothetical protein AAGD00_10465 [Planctomycetota bacterium]
MNHHPDPNELPDDLRPTGAALDRLADRDAERAPAGLEDRIFVRTRSQFGSAHESLEEAPKPIGRIGARWWLAAAAAVAVTGASVVLVGPPAPTAGGAELAQIESDFDALLAEFDETEALSTQIESVERDLYALSLNTTWLDLLVPADSQTEEGA